MIRQAFGFGRLAALLCLPPARFATEYRLESSRHASFSERGCVRSISRSGFEYRGARLFIARVRSCAGVAAGPSDTAALQFFHGTAQGFRLFWRSVSIGVHPWLKISEKSRCKPAPKFALTDEGLLCNGPERARGGAGTPSGPPAKRS